MMQSLLTIKDAVTGALKAMDKSILLLTENEWKMLTAVAEILKPFDDITTELSSQYYPSLSIYPNSSPKPWHSASRI